MTNQNLKLKIVPILIVLLSFELSAAQTGDVNNPSSQRTCPISKILTQGNHSVSSTQILSKVRSRAGELFEPAVAAEDTKRIAEVAGVEYCYYNTAVIEEQIQLTFVIVEKNIARSITFTGNHKYKSKTLQGKLNIKVGDYLDSLQAEAGRAAVAEFYLKKGYAFVQVNLDTKQLSSGKLVYTIEEGSRGKIESVGFHGNKVLKTKELKKAVKTKKKNWVFWQAYYIEENLTKDVAKLQTVYYDRGFLDASITPKREFNKDKSKVRIIFEIIEGPAYTIDKIIITGNKYFDEKKLQLEFKLGQGQIYSEKKADSDIKQILKLYRENGFIDAKVEYSRKFVSQNTVDAEFNITEGQRFRIGQITITGNEQTQDKVVRRVLDEYDFRPGEWYNADIARGDGSGELEKLVGSTVMSENRTTSITSSGTTPGQKDAQVSVIEGQTGMVMLGAGVASDSGVMGQIVFEQKNFDISDKPESFSEFITGQAFKGAGQDLRIALQPGTEFSEYSISFTEPYFQDKPVSLDVVGSSYERGRESYDEQRTKGYFGFEKRYRDRWRRSIGFRLENVDVDSIDSDAPKEIKDVKGGNLLAGVRFGIGKDLTNDRFNPSKGYSFNTAYEQVGGDHTFGILSSTHKQYFTLYEDLAERKTILATKLHASTTVGNAPPFEKFYAGGSGFYGIRGFDYRGVSTRGYPTFSGTDTEDKSHKRKDPIGSDWIFLASAETVIPLVGDNFGALLFVDSGTIDTGKYRASIGTGIQILIPQWFGPVPMRFELATPIAKDEDDETQVFSFSVGRLF